MSTIFRISSLPSRLKMMVSSIRFRNSGLKVALSSAAMASSHVVDLGRGLDEVPADVAGHDDEAVAEVHHPALAVGEPPLVQELQQRR